MVNSDTLAIDGIASPLNPKDEILNLNLWEGDYLFLNKMYKDDSYFEMELVYVSDKLISYKVKE